MDMERARVVAEDLEYLFAEWNQDIDDASLRRSSPVLRSLLIEGLLNHVAREVDKPLQVMTPAIGRLMTDAELG